MRKDCIADGIVHFTRWTAGHYVGTAIATLVVTAVVLLLASLARHFLQENAQSIGAVRDAVAALGILTIVLAVPKFLSDEREKLTTERDRLSAEKDRRARITLDSTQLALKFMLEFYKDDGLEEVRRALRDRTPLAPQVYGHPGGTARNSMRPDVVQVMNYFEAMAIAVREGCLGADLVYRMLGTPMCEVALHPEMKGLLQPRYSYEVFKHLLSTEILPRKKNEGWDVSGAQAMLD